jgi:hypothetical protein
MNSVTDEDNSLLEWYISGKRSEAPVPSSSGQASTHSVKNRSVIKSRGDKGERMGAV